MKAKYSDEQMKIFVDMWNNGHTAAEISEKLGGSLNSIRQFACRYRKKYGLERREGGRIPPHKNFDKAWHGVIPCGHWSITKPWGSQCR